MPAKLIFATKNIHVTKEKIGKQYKMKKNVRRPQLQEGGLRLLLQNHVDLSTITISHMSHNKWCLNCPHFMTLNYMVYQITIFPSQLPPLDNGPQEPGWRLPLQICADQLFLFQPGVGQTMPTTLLLPPPPLRFSVLPTALDKMHARKIETFWMSTILQLKAEY